MQGHGGKINHLTNHPFDNNVVISSSGDHSIRMWNIESGMCLCIFGGHNGHRDEVLCSSVHINGRYLASCSIDHSIKIWDLYHNDNSIKSKNTSMNEIELKSFESIDKWIKESYNVSPNHENTKPRMKKSIKNNRNPNDNNNNNSNNSKLTITNDEISIENNMTPSSDDIGDEKTDNKENKENLENNEMNEIAFDNADDISCYPSKMDSNTLRQHCTKMEQFPIYDRSKIHTSGVDHIDWIGDFILSKSVESMIKIWKPPLTDTVVCCICYFDFFDF